MSGRRDRAWPSTYVAALAVALGTAIVGCELLSCPEEEPIPIEDGAHQGESAGAQRRIRDATATIEGEELMIQYVQDTDGRTYMVRLRERE